MMNNHVTINRDSPDWMSTCARDLNKIIINNIIKKNIYYTYYVIK